MVILAHADVLGLDFYQDTPLYTCFTQRFVLGRKAGGGRDRGRRIGLLSGQPSTHNYLKKQSLFSESHLVSEDRPISPCVCACVAGATLCSLKALTKFTLHNHHWRGHMTTAKWDSPQTSSSHLTSSTLLQLVLGALYFPFLIFLFYFIFLQREQPLLSPSQRMCCLLPSFSRKHPGCCHPSTRKIQVGHFEHSRACVWKHRDLSRILFSPSVSNLQFAPAAYRDSSILEHKQGFPTIY